ncbi:MAG: hypothetical protein IPK62_14260 [Bacteroidetes bacterium]|nr:hypothetical protein [Bacteroidota bacterium]
MPKELNIFFSYGVEGSNKTLLTLTRDKFNSKLTNRDRKKIIVNQDSFFIKPTEDWAELIKEKLELSNWFIFFISEKFMASRVAIPTELKCALDKYEVDKNIKLLLINLSPYTLTNDKVKSDIFKKVNDIHFLNRDYCIIKDKRDNQDLDSGELLEYSDTLASHLHSTILSIEEVGVETHHELNTKKEQNIVLDKLHLCGRNDNRTKLDSIKIYKIDYEKKTTPFVSLFAEDKQRIRYFFAQINEYAKNAKDNNRVRLLFPESTEQHNIETGIYHVVDKFSIENSSYQTQLIQKIQGYFENIKNGQYGKVCLPIILKVKASNKNRLIEKLLCSLTNNEILLKAIDTNSYKIDYEVVLYICLSYNSDFVNDENVEGYINTLITHNAENETFEIDTLDNLKKSEVEDWLKLKPDNQSMSISDYIISYANEKGNQTTNAYQALNITNDNLPFIELENKLIQFFS